jgi:uncharacterized protein YhaN
MRLNRLDLTRYGKFTDQSLSFAAPPGGSPDFHVIYGANEAGKSTLLSAWLDLLFQIPVRSTMNFLHPHGSMQLGAALDIDGQTHDLIRVKKRDHSLLDLQGVPQVEALLQGGLRGLDRASYAAMFSLNRQTLDDGGQSILASEGDLGELLFQASAGLSDLATQLEAHRGAADEFLNTTGRKGRLKELRAEFDALGDQMKDLDTAAAEFSRLAKARDAAHEAWQSTRQEAETAQAGIIETERLVAALPLALRLKRYESEIADYGDLPAPPEVWLDELPVLDRAETEMATRLEAAHQAVSGLESEMKNAPQDIEVLSKKSEFDHIETLKSAYDTALTDLPKRLKEQQAAKDTVRASLVHLGRSGGDAAALLPDVGLCGRLRGLVDGYAAVAKDHASASTELTRAKTEATRSADRLQKAGGSTADLGGLGGLVQGIRRDDPAGTLARAQAGLAQTEADLAEKCAALAPWSGDAAALENLIPPDRAALDQLARETEAAIRRFTQESDSLARLENEQAQRQSRSSETENATRVTLEQAADIRAQREAAWARHRVALTPETADLFEAGMRLDDQITAAAADQRGRAELAQAAKRALAEAQELTDAAKSAVARAQGECDTLAQRLTRIIAATLAELPVDMSLSGFQAWVAGLQTARDALRQRNNAARILAQSDAAVRTAQKALLQAMQQAGRDMAADTGLALALETAQSLLDRATEIAVLSDADTVAKQALADREEALHRAATALTQWQAEWQAACAETWMADAPPDAPQMRAVLDELDLLRGHLDRRHDLDRRITAMQGNKDQFAQAVAALDRDLGGSATGQPHDIWRQLFQRLRAAETADNQHNTLQTRLKSAQDALDDLGRNAKIHRRRIAEISGFFGVTTWAQTRAALSRAKDRAAVLKTRQDAVDDLCTRTRSANLPEALQCLEGLDETSLAARAQGLETDLAVLRANQDEAHTAYRDAESALNKVGGDGAVARLEEQRQTLLLEMAEGARQHLQKRLGLLAVDAALRHYRDTHRSGMLNRASEAFYAMSLGRYSGLAAQPDGSREVLVALAAEGGSKQAEQLSEGTRAQLYLALRIAGYHEFTRNNGPVPFIADDIMESFDDARAARAFELLGAMSTSGQVIYLTHHAHICGLAQKACPAVQIHQLEM